MGCGKQTSGQSRRNDVHPLDTGTFCAFVLKFKNMVEGEIRSRADWLAEEQQIYVSHIQYVSPVSPCFFSCDTL